MSWFSIIGRMSMDSTQFESGLKRAESAATGAARKIGSDFKRMIGGAFTIGAITAFTKSVVAAGDRIGDLAEQFALTNKEVQQLEVLSNRTGVTMDKMLQAIAKFSELRAKAAGGDDKAIGLLGRQGISEQAIASNRTNLELLTEISEHYANGSRSIQDNADALEIFGSKAFALANTMKGLKDLGPIKMFSDEDIEALGAFDANFKELLRQAKIAAGPTVGGVGMWLKRGMALDEAGDPFALSNSFFETVMGWNPEADIQGGERNDPITPGEIQAARLEMFKRSGNFPPGYNPAGRDSGEFYGPDVPKPTAIKTKAERYNPFISTSGMASQGFGYFGGGYNQQVLSELKQQVKALEKIVTHTANMDDSLKPE